jgi:hypothetical protein
LNGKPFKMDPDRAIEFIQTAAACVAAWRLADLKLASRFPAMVSWLCVLGVTNLAGGILSRFQGAYFWLYTVYVPLTCTFGFFAVRELFALVFTDYPGIRSVGRWSMYAGTTLATIASIVISAYFRRTSTEGSVHLFYLEVAQRSIVFSLAIVIATILFFLSRYPLHLGWNTYVACGFFSALFLSDAVRLLLDSLQTLLHNDVVDWAESAFIVICLLAWASILRPHSPPKPLAPAPPTPHEEHLLAQLAAINQMLGRTARR